MVRLVLLAVIMSAVQQLKWMNVVYVMVAVLLMVSVIAQAMLMLAVDVVKLDLLAVIMSVAQQLK